MRVNYLAETQRRRVRIEMEKKIDLTRTFR